ncbi:MAG: universal stress protein [Pseudomonadota bacterium]
MLKALVPVDGSANSIQAIRHVIKLIKDREPLEVHLLNVQPSLDGETTRFVSHRTVEEFHREEGVKILRPACDLLDAAGIPYHCHVGVGRPAKVIAHYANDLHCDKLIMGTRGLGTISQLLLGSVTHEVIHLIDPAIPVTLVKKPR